MRSRIGDHIRAPYGGEIGVCAQMRDRSLESRLGLAIGIDDADEVS
jgi:hypothetical protein